MVGYGLLDEEVIFDGYVAIGVIEPGQVGLDRKSVG